MKKLLALVLALVMTLGLATVSANAAEFADQSDISYDEAVKVLSTVGVLGGEGDNKFNPKGELTRAAGAKIIAYLDLGEATAEAMPATQIFDDVPSTFWGAKYIAYCYTAGIIGGVGNNKFDPDAPLSGYAFGKMLLCVLGYDADLEGFGGANWQLNVAKAMGSNDISKGVEKTGSAVLTREEAAQYALNALKADTVDYDTKGTTINVGGTTDITVGASKAKSVTDNTTVTEHNTIGNEGVVNTVVQLGEKLYKGDLILRNDRDDMGRIASRWTWKANTVIGRFAKDADHKVVVKKEGKTLDDIIDDISKDYITTTIDATTGSGIYVNGNNNLGTSAATNLRVGDVVELWMTANATNTIQRVAITRYSSAKVTGATATNSDGEVRVPGVVASFTDPKYVTGYTGLAKDDIVYYYTGLHNDGTVTTHIAKAESFDGQLTTIKTSSDPDEYVIGGSSYVINGNIYTAQNGRVAGLALNNSPKYNTNFAYYTDDNGFIVYAKQLEEVNKNYVAINALQYAKAGSLAGSSRIEARLVHVDGTVEVVPVASIDDGTNFYTGATATATADPTNGGTSALADSPYGAANTYFLVYNTGAVTPPVNSTAASRITSRAAGYTAAGMMFTYKVNSDGEYELTTANKADGSNVTTGTLNLNGTAVTIKPTSGRFGDDNDGIAVNDDTVFVVLNDPTSSTVKTTVYTGKGNVPQFDSLGTNDIKVVYTAEKSVATTMYIYDYGTKNAAGDRLFILSDKAVADSTVKDSNGRDIDVKIWVAYKDGAVAQIPVSTTLSTTLALHGGIGEFTPTYDTNGILTGVTRTNGNWSYEGFTGTPLYTTTLGLYTSPLYGYNMSGTTLSAGKTYAANTYFTSFNAPASTPVIFKDTKDNFTVGTMADLDADANDVIYVIRTNATDQDNIVRYAYVIQRDVDNSKLQQVAVNDGQIDGGGVAAGQALALTKGGTGTGNDANNSKTITYTIYGTNPGNDALSSTTTSVTLLAEAGSRIEYKINNGSANWDDAADGTASDDPAPSGTATWTRVTSNGTPLAGSYSAAVTVTGNDYLMVRVIAEDTSVSYYLIVND